MVKQKVLKKQKNVINANFSNKQTQSAHKSSATHAPSHDKSSAKSSHNDHNKNQFFPQEAKEASNAMRYAAHTTKNITEDAMKKAADMTKTMTNATKHMAEDALKNMTSATKNMAEDAIKNASYATRGAAHDANKNATHAFENLQNSMGEVSKIISQYCDHMYQNHEFASHIASKLHTNLNLVMGDIYNAYSKYATGMVACRNFEDFQNKGAKLKKELENITHQMMLISGQIGLDITTDMLSPTLKQYSACCAQFNKIWDIWNFDKSRK